MHQNKRHSCLISSPALAFQEFQFKFLVDVDASGTGLGAQEIGGKEKVVTYASRSLNKPQRKYCATRKEMLELVWAIKHFKFYLYGHPFIVRTDHAALKWPRSFKEPEGQVAQWIGKLQEYDFDVIHRAGLKHSNTDALSRKQCHWCDLTFDEPLEIFATDCSGDTWLPNWNHSQLCQYQREDLDISTIIQWLENNSLPEQFPKSASHSVQSLWNQRQQLIVQNKLLYRTWEDVLGGGCKKTPQLVLPHKLVSAVLLQLDDARTAAHLGVMKT